ncbi:hypothetical protein HGD80_02115 [Paulownia witches'-broom phytoplasma]|uniref:Uncharacterized protein n=1 Tax=Paulownia witches'-broom phytoplasma TaxID=39647 RepID=A0ABX8TPV3_9MOLU|nr:hypothetical protein [Paulownia witches'-broom phytoplasma]QYC31346.1 hypothetical protein HGD80_02115 [Paulownia witches'-broom phytoplasma]
MTLRQILILIALGCIFIFAAYKLGLLFLMQLKLHGLNNECFFKKTLIKR